MTIALLPLDERPVNTRYPQMLGAIGGAEVLLPPPEILGRQREPADLPAVAAWLREAAQISQAAIISVDFLGYGNLINARISEDSAVAVVTRLGLLAEINARIPVHAFSLITRVANADDCVEEPLYWAQWGTKFARYARLVHQGEQGGLAQEAEREELTQLEHMLPADLKADWLTRRLRNHTVNLGLLEMAARGQIESLLLTSDDTGAFGFPSRERDWLRGWGTLIGAKLTERVMMHPGADEVGSALVAKLINAGESRTPRVWIEYAVPGGEEIVAPYEDRPVRETVLGQLSACGCVPAATPEDSDFVLGVVTPSPRRTDYRPEYLDSDRIERTKPYARFLARLGEWQLVGKPIAVADVAYPNGADPLFIGMLLEAECPLRPGSLAAYGAWNTAGNTLGTTVAQGSCALRIGDDPQRQAAQELFLAHRFLEDYSYQTVVRREARTHIEAHRGRRDPLPDSLEEQVETCAFIEQRLAEISTELQTRGVGTGLKIAPGSVRLPWRRTFEVDFTLEEDGSL